VVEIPPHLTRRLIRFLRHKRAGQLLWPGRWVENAAEMLRVDLERAKIPYKTHDGYFDFHATRHTAITNGAKLMRITQLKEFARHTKIEMTMRYNHEDQKELAVVVQQLPDLPALSRATRNRRTNPVKPDQKSDQTVRSGRDLMSSVVRRVAQARNDASPDNVRACASDVTGYLQRARRGSNPQPPDRQSGTLTN
jgi:hypothetical protein